MSAIDREVGHWFTSTHPASPFREGPMIARALRDGGRVTLRGDQLTLRVGGRVDRRILATPERVLDALEQCFGLCFPEGTVFGADDYRTRYDPLATAPLARSPSNPV
jgi:arylamine N-acetyltransferase